MIEKRALRLIYVDKIKEQEQEELRTKMEQARLEKIKARLYKKSSEYKRKRWEAKRSVCNIGCGGTHVHAACASKNPLPFDKVWAWPNFRV